MSETKQNYKLLSHLVTALSSTGRQVQVQLLDGRMTDIVTVFDFDIQSWTFLTNGMHIVPDFRLENWYQVKPNGMRSKHLPTNYGIPDVI